MDKYTLDKNGNPVIEEDLLTWGAWFKEADRHTALDKFDGIKVSTVFLGLDHSFGGGRPVLWETMIFGGKYDLDQERYTNEEDAIKGHKRMLKKAKEKGRKTND